VLAADGKTLIDKGGTSLATVDEKGTSVDRTSLSAVSEDGDAIEPVPSSFNEPNKLRKAEIEIISARCSSRYTSYNRRRGWRYPVSARPSRR
jgi:hypothetical protein